MTNPLNYKTQKGLLKAINKASNLPMTVSLAIWFQNAKYQLINGFGWDEKQASRYIAGYQPLKSVYFSTGV